MRIEIEEPVLKLNLNSYQKPKEDICCGFRVEHVCILEKPTIKEVENIAIGSILVAPNRFYRQSLEAIKLRVVEEDRFHVIAPLKPNGSYFDFENKTNSQNKAKIDLSWYDELFIRQYCYNVHVLKIIGITNYIQEEALDYIKEYSGLDIRKKINEL